MIAVVNKLLEPFKSLKNIVFAKLFLAETISLMGDAFTWVGLALLAYELDSENSAAILATALTLRVTAFIIFSPFSGVLSDNVDRKKILYITHFVRMLIVCCLPFITAEWQVYVLVFFLNVFNAFFTPTYKAIIPQIVENNYYREAIGLSTATYQLLGVLGPALAGIVAVWFGAREIFFIDAISFVIAAVIILSISKNELSKGTSNGNSENKDTWDGVLKGVRLLFGNKSLQFSLCIEFISAIAGAMILVNTISLIKKDLLLGDSHYGWVMAFFGIGAMLSAFFAGVFDKSKTRSLSLIFGALILGAAICFANSVSFNILLLLWLIAGLGQSLAEMPSETLIAENINSEDQGKVYGSHFAFSHLWWAIAYPIAGYLGRFFPKTDFFIGGYAALILTVLAIVIFRKRL